MTNAITKFVAGAFGDRVVEGRQASRGKALGSAVVAGGAVAVAVYRFLRSGDARDEDDEVATQEPQA